jgi:potassium efflux system protein
MKQNLRRSLNLLVTIWAVTSLVATATVASASATRPSKRSSVVSSSAAASVLDPNDVAALAQQVDEAGTQLDAISLHARSNGLSDTQLRSRIAAIPPIQAKLADALDNLDPRLKSADARLEQLGRAPAADAPPEDPEITQSRREILRYRQSVDTEVKQARLLATEAVQLNADLGDRRRRLFSERLWVHSRSVLDPKLWVDFAQDAPADLGQLNRALDQECALIAVRAGSASAAAIWALAGLLAAMLVASARIMLNRWGETRLARPSTAVRSAAALIAVWWVVVAGLTPLIAGLSIQAALTDTGALTPLFAQILSLFWKTIVFGALLEGVARALLAPRWPAWRVAPISNAAARRLARYPGMIAASAALAGLVSGLNGVLGSSSTTTEAAGYLTIIVQLAVILSGLSQIGRARAEQAEAASGADRPNVRLPWIVAATLAWLTLASAGAAIMAGYLAFATFLLRELVWAAAVMAAVFIFMRGFDAAIAWLLSPARTLGRAIRISIGLSSLGLEQVAELASGLVRLCLLLAGWAAILAPLGADAQDVFGRVTSTDLVLRFGQVTISPGALAGALLVLGIGLAATQTLRGWLESRYLPKTRMDLSVRTSLASGVTYVGILVAFLLTCADLGLSLDRIALFASALTVGIGFGLQGIIGNFVSGLILLTERPVKVGDWIAIGDLEGDIRRINVRATEIEMRDRSRLIVPNSELVSKMVRNVTHGASLGRVKIVLSLDAQSDPLTVRDLLMQHLSTHPDALADPPPAVYLTDIKDGAMEFTAFVYLASPREAYKTKSDLLFQILPDLKARGMAIATSNPVVRVELADRPIEPSGAPS